MQILNPNFELEKYDISSWKKLEGINPSNTADIFISPDKKYVNKIKEYIIKGNSEKEFANNLIWKEILNIYIEEYGVDIDVPEPQFADETNFVMDHVDGIELIEKITNETDKNYLEKLTFSIGQLLKIKANEGLNHNELRLRHILINDRLNIIDLEDTSLDYNSLDGDSLYLIDNLCKLIDLDENILQQGVKSIPDESLFEDALDSIQKKYGSHMLDLLPIEGHRRISNRMSYLISGKSF